MSTENKLMKHDPRVIEAQGWIRCKERLPAEGLAVSTTLFTRTAGFTRSYLAEIHSDTVWFRAGTLNVLLHEPTHWKPNS